MTEVTADIATATGRSTGRSLFKVDERTRKRHAAERRFRMMGLAAVIFSIVALVGLMTSILSNGLSSFRQTYVTMDIHLDAAKLATADRAGEYLSLVLPDGTTEIAQLEALAAAPGLNRT